MNHAAGAFVLRMIVDALHELSGCAGTACIERVKQRGGRVALGVEAHDAVPESIDSNGSGLQIFGAHLFTDGVDGAGDDFGEFGGVDFPATVRGGVSAIGNLRTEVLDLAAVKAEQ